jgi:hypothetical protein
MNKSKRFVFSLSTLILFSGVALATAPAYAEHGSSGSGSDDTTTVATASDDSTTGTQTETEVENHARDLTEQFRLQAQQKLAEKKAQVKEQTQEHRQQACEARKTNLTKRMSSAVAQAERHKAVFDKIYTRVQDFYTNKKLNVSDFDSMKAKVDSAQADAAASIQALQNTDVSVDCTSSTVANSVGAFQTAVGSTRDFLKAYRAALVELINSLKGASTGQSADNTQDTTNTTNQ